MARLKTYGKRRSIRYPGHDYSLPYIYHVIISAHKPNNVLNRDEFASVIAYNINQLAQHLSYEILAFCIMPDHLHVLCQPQNSAASLQIFVGQLKGRISRKIGKRRSRRPLWQRGFYDHVLRKDEDVWAVAKYIAKNPVRSGLAINYEDYPYSYIKDLKRSEFFPPSP